MQDGQKALQQKKYDDAVKAFGDAQKLQPSDVRASQFLKQAQKLLNDTKGAEPKKKMSLLGPVDSPEREPWLAVSRSQDAVPIRREQPQTWFDPFPPQRIVISRGILGALNGKQVIGAFPNDLARAILSS